MHKSKNRSLAQWELRERALRKKLRKQGQGSPDILEKRKLAIMREVLFDQYQMQDVLERSDRAMAVVKDLFGDAPHRHAGFPNVTMAPDSEMDTSVGPIAQKRDSLTQLSILSESVMDSQALNEDVENSQSECSEDGEEEVDASMNFKSSVDMNRFRCLLNEKDNSFSQSRTKPPPLAGNLPKTPKTPVRPSTAEPSSALNATTVVRRVKSRLGMGDGASAALNGLSPENTLVVGQVLNPGPGKKKRTAAKGKKSRRADAPSAKERECYQPSSSTFNLSNGNQSSLEVLHHMIGEVEQEMEEFERQTGRMVKDQRSQTGQGLTGFTASLLGTLSRLVRYLKETEVGVRWGQRETERLREQSREQRQLIDALTAEMLSIREELTVAQTRLQQYMMVTDEKMISLQQALASATTTDSGALHTNTDPGERPVRHQESCQVSWPPSLKGKEAAETPLEQQSVPFQPRASPAERRCETLPERLFQPAVLLSPPRQLNRRGTVPESRSGTVTCEEWKPIEIHPKNEAVTPPHSRAQELTRSPTVNRESGGEANLCLCQPCEAPILEADSQSASPALSYASLSRQMDDVLSGREAVGGDGDEKQGGAQVDAALQQEALLSHVAELTLQNSTIKAQLSQFMGAIRAADTAQQQPAEMQNVNGVTTQKTVSYSLLEKKSVPLALGQSTLEERIAELNRQSAEARKKLLLLIDQHKQATSGHASPPISPITAQDKQTGHYSHRAWDFPSCAHCLWALPKA
nr:PREDICTED: spindle and centriole-associated protein 1 [Latimeria chalumnae]|eukprot:XP_014346282.1 PREDICTED: spindle and centriole-associated protein 1 [Latimeria chalumnae]